MGSIIQFPTASEPEDVSLRIALSELSEGLDVEFTPEMPELKPHVPALKSLLRAYQSTFSITIKGLQENQVDEVRLAIDKARRQLFAEAFFNILCAAGIMVKREED
jgi:hypothetical protein